MTILEPLVAGQMTSPFGRPGSPKRAMSEMGILPFHTQDDREGRRKERKGCP